MSPFTTYLRNRRGFYETIARRIPLRRLRTAIEEAAGTHATDVHIMQTMHSTDEASLDEQTPAAIALWDLLKKDSAGTELARLAISIEDVLARSEMVEMVGIQLFLLLLEKHPKETEALNQVIAQRKASLSKIVHLRDDLRYHRVNLLSSG